MSLDWCKHCDHSDRIIDEREGNEVCIKCGLVMEPFYTYSSNYINNNCSNLLQYDMDKEKCLIKEENDLNTLCDKLHLCANTKQKVFKMWESVKKWYSDPKNKNKRKHNKYGLIIMTLYQTLIELNIPRPMSHLCQEAGINQKIVWQWMKLYNIDNEDIVNPSNMCEYFLKPLNLAYKELNEKKNDKTK